MASQKTVTINVYGNGDFNYSFALLGVSGGDTITWNGGPDTGAFSIRFQTASPLTTGGPSYESSGSGNTIVGTIANNLTVGTVYKYSVTALNIPTNKNWSDGACPELIIR